MDGPYTGLYADNPFTTTINEGIPTNGNRIDPFRKTRPYRSSST